MGIRAFFAVVGLLLFSGGCSTTLEGIEESGPDAGAGIVNAFPDAGEPVDTGPEPLPCVEGTNQHLDPTDNTCYMLFATPATWSGAQAACLGVGSTLATVKSSSQQDIVSTLAGDHPVGSPDLWLGATDEQTEGSFLWIDQDPLTFAKWRVDEPNNGNGGGIENCMIIEGDTSAREWDDRPCAALNPYLCARTVATQ